MSRLRDIGCSFRFPAYTILAVVFLAPTAVAQNAHAFSFGPPAETDTLAWSPARTDTLLRLRHEFLLAGSDTVTIDSAGRLTRGRDYSIDYRYGIIRLDTAVMRRLAAKRPHGTMVVRYAYLPFRFQDSYSHRTLFVLRDSTGRDSIHIARPRSSFSVEDIFGPNLQKSGSIVRGFTVGSNRDLTLNSGLRMQLSGKISSDIDVAASLTDDNTPIQPEGTTQTLQEFDKVFVEIRSTDVAATLGDYNLDFTGTEFGGISRKLQGAEGTADYRVGDGAGSVTVSGAITRGKFNTNQFGGIEGVQGPYRLSGKNGERTILVIAGTEKVYVDGERQARGEVNDYTIDYGTGEVTFTERRLITSASRIVIDFEYTDRQFSRSLFATQATSSLFGQKANLSIEYMREADDPNAPIDYVIDDSARQILALAGGDRNKAVQSGATLVDSNGAYLQVDTLLPGGNTVQFFRYAPGDPNARYIVYFSSVPFGQGDYVRQQVGIFVWQGAGNGDYVALRYLPMPQLEQLMDIALDGKPAKDLKVGGEFARSMFDPNRFSSLDKASGNAYLVHAEFQPRDVRLAGADIGGFDLSARDRFVNSDFVPIDRTNDIEFNRKWGIDSLAPANEEIREGSLKYYPSRGVTLGSSYGSIDRGSQLSSRRNDGTVSLLEEGLPKTTYYIEDVRSREGLLDNSSSWLRQKGSMEYTLGEFTPSVRYEGEDRSISSLSSDSLQDGSFHYDMVTSGLAFHHGTGTALSAVYEWRTDDLFNGGSVQRASKSFTQTYSGKYAASNDFGTNLDVTLRTKSFSPVFRGLGNNDIRTVLVRSETRYTPLQRALESDLFYEVSTEQSAKLERVFVRVADGTGNYAYLGDLNHNGIADEDEFTPARFDGNYVVVTVPTDQLYPVINLNTSFRLRETPARLLGRGPGSSGSLLSVISGETYARVGEKSGEPDLKQIYLLHFSKFQQDSTTITGSNLFSQDLFLFEGSPLFSLRFRFSQQRGLNNFAGGVERTLVRERSVRMRIQLVPEISNQIDYVNKVDRLSSTEISNRVRNIYSDELTYDLAYRPEQDVELGIKFDVGRFTDRFEVPPLVANLNTQTVRFVYAFQGAGQAHVEAGREEIRLGGSSDSYPYELTGGRVVGKTWLWQASFDYRVTQFIQATMNYNGRAEGSAPPVHTGRMEVRAFF